MQTTAVSRAAFRRGLALVTTAAVLWGTVGVAGQLLYNHTDLSPPTVGFYRLALAAVLLVTLRAGASRRRALGVTCGDLPAMLLVGASLAAYQVCFFAAVQAAGVSIATLVTLGLAPVLVAAGVALFQREMPGRIVLIALASALAGLGLLVGVPAQAAGGGNLPLGAALAVGSATGYAGLTLLSRSLTGRVAARDLTTIGFTVGAVLLLPLAAASGLAVEPTFAAWGALLYLGAVPSALAYVLFFFGLRTVIPTVATILTLLEPLTAATLAALLFGERLGGAGLVGGGLLLATVLLLYVSDSGSRREAASAPFPHRPTGRMPAEERGSATGTGG